MSLLSKSTQSSSTISFNFLKLFIPFILIVFMVPDALAEEEGNSQPGTSIPAQIDGLQQQIDTIELTPGADGADGKDGVDAVAVLYDIGDRGPAGGWVIYVTNDGKHGLEVAPEDALDAQGDPIFAQWGCHTIEIYAAYSHHLGAGARNTDQIIKGCQEVGHAAKVADEYVSPSGYIDWYLPSIGELDSVGSTIGAGNAFFISSLLSTTYWSSTNVRPYDAFVAFIPNSQQVELYPASKLGALGVRAVRAF